MDQKVARGLKLSSTIESRIKTAGKSIDARTSEDNMISIGQIVLESQSIEVFSLQHLSDYLKMQVDGVIGHELLKRYVVRTDIEKMKMYLYDTTSYTYLGDGKEVRIVDMEHHHFGIPLSFKPKKQASMIILPFKIDTGFSGHLVIHNHAVKDHQLLTSKKYKKNIGFGADSTKTTNLRSKVKEVSFAGQTWKNIPAVFEIDPINIEANNSSKSFGLIGQKLLLGFNIVYDYLRNMIYLEDRKK
jgi:hypothetical protein